MKKDQVVILEKRGVILVSGEDAKDFLQNIITNDINKVSSKKSVFAALLTPQGKYLNEFFIIQNNKGYLLDCSENSTSELIKDLSKYGILEGLRPLQTPPKPSWRSPPPQIAPLKRLHHTLKLSLRANINSKILVFFIILAADGTIGLNG